MTTTIPALPTTWLEMITKPPAPPPPRAPRTTPPGADVFSAYNNHVDLPSMLARDGAYIGPQVMARARAGRAGGPYSTVIRPGKDGHPRGRSATLWYGQGGAPDRLYVFTTDWPRLPPSEDEGHAYSAFDYITHTRHAGNITAARREAAEITGWKDTVPTPTIGTAASVESTPAEPQTPEEADAELAEVLKMANLIDWSKLANGDNDPEDWLVRPIIPRGRAVALVAATGVGKSLLTLYTSACLATGRPVFGEVQPRVKVLYGDWENTEADIQERLESMGFDLEELTGWLYLSSFAEFGALNHKVGADRLVLLAKHLEVELVVIDTFGRVIEGKENDADPFREFYAHCGMKLKQAQIAQVRLDHASFKADKKEGPKSARGSSEKAGDVDIVWMMSKTDTGYTLTCDPMKGGKRRVKWAPYVVEVDFVEGDETAFRLKAGTESTWLPGVTAKTAELDALKVPLDAPRRKAAQMLKEGGKEPGSARVLGQALKFRRTRNPLVPVMGTHGMPQNQDRPGTTSGTTGTNAPESAISAGQGMGTNIGNQSPPALGTSGGYTEWNHRYQPTSADAQIDESKRPVVAFDPFVDPYAEPPASDLNEDWMV